MAQRVGLGVARTGGVGEHNSGDLFLCFATGNRGMTTGELDHDSDPTVSLRMLSDSYITGLFDAVVTAPGPPNAVRPDGATGRARRARTGGAWRAQQPGPPGSRLATAA